MDRFAQSHQGNLHGRNEKNAIWLGYDITIDTLDREYIIRSSNACFNVEGLVIFKPSWSEETAALL